MSHTPPAPATTHQELILAMVRAHHGTSLMELKNRMQAAHGSTHLQVENTVARLYRIGKLQNRSTLARIPCICTPGCKSLPAQVTPNQRAAAQAANAPRQQATQPEPNQSTGHLSKGGAGHLCAPPRAANASDLVEHIIRLLLTLADGERLDAEQVATRLGIPIEVTAVRNALSQMDYHGKVRSRYNAERTRLLYSIDPSTAELLRQKAAQASATPATPTGQQPAKKASPAADGDDGIPPGQYNPAALQCVREDGKAFLACPSLRNGKPEAYNGIRGMCTGAGGPTAYNTPRLKQ